MMKSIQSVQLRRFACGAAATMFVWSVTADPPGLRYASWYAAAIEGVAMPALQAGDAATSAPSVDAAPPPMPAEDEMAPEAAPSWVDPIHFSITYSLYSDYASRALNLSEYPQEGREDPNHQLTTSLEVDTARLFGREEGEFGTFAFETFFEWFAGQDMLDPVYGAHNCQEIDYSLSYSYEVKPLHTTLTGGYVFYAFPNHKEIATQEWFFRIDHNDAWMWSGLWPDNEDGVVNPYLQYWQDADFISRSAWWQFGFSHDFALAKDVTLTPTIDFGVDHHFIHPALGAGDGTQGLASIQYGGTISYDMSELLGIEKWGFGSVVLSGFLYFSEAMGNPKDDGLTRDELFGGMSVGWSF